MYCVPEFKPVYVYGLVVAFCQPVDAAVGAGAAKGNASTCQAVAVPFSVHPTVTEFVVVAKTVVPVGTKQVGAGLQVTLANHPVALFAAPLLNLKVKQPFGLEEVKGPGAVVPQNDPANPPGTVPGPFKLIICSAAVEFPLKTYKPSAPVSTEKDVNVTVTCSPGIVGQTV